MEAAALATLPDEQMLEIVQRQTFNFFWDGAHPVSGLAPDRSTTRANAADDKVALFSYFYLDLPLDEAARVMGVPLGTAKSRIYRAARRLRPDVALEEVIDR